MSGGGQNQSIFQHFFPTLQPFSLIISRYIDIVRQEKKRSGDIINSMRSRNVRCQIIRRVYKELVRKQQLVMSRPDCDRVERRTDRRC